MIAEILGRFHPLIVHLPVGILLLAFMMQLATSYNRLRHLQSAIPFVLAVAIGFSMIAWFTGWVMPKEGEFDERLIRLHFWMAVSMTIGNVLVYVCLVSKNSFLNKVYMPLFIVTIILLSLTGHFGGSLTHGEDHLTAPLSMDANPKVQSADSLYVYADIVVPILKARCYSCHNDAKKKGSFDMTSEEGLIKGGSQGIGIEKGNSLRSPVIQRILLPLDENEHMPPRGKKQLTDDELALLDWWVSQGATFSEQVYALDKSDKIQSILKKYEQGALSLDLSKIPIVSDKDKEQLRKNGINVLRQKMDSPLLRVSLARDTAVSARRLKLLKRVDTNIAELDLSYTNVDDDMLNVLSTFKHLQVLKLQHTRVGSNAIKHLAKLEHLYSLNLYDTNVDEECLTTLGKITSLRSLFMWQTMVPTDVLDSFARAHPMIDIHSGVDSKMFGVGELKPPNIVIVNKDLGDSTIVKMNVGLSDVTIRYTIDGTEPDSSSLLYKRPLVFDETTVLTAKAYKEGWNHSVNAQKIITKKGISIEKIELSKSPNEKYAGNGVASLNDQDKGSNKFGDGSWLGFYAEDVTITLTLDSIQSINNVIVGALEDIGSYIFCPKEISVSSSKSGRNYKVKKNLIIETHKEPRSARYHSYLLTLPDHKARYVKIKLSGMIKNPEWHAAPGADSWMFIDEVFVD